jgi:cyclophilin family peptidyl-prolyl cis-trans isomerase
MDMRKLERRWLGWLILAFGVAFSGCQQEEAPPDTPPPQPKISGPSSDARPEPRLHQPFRQATLQEPPEGQWLPDKTKTGKSVGKLYVEIAGADGSGGLWDQIVFRTAKGKRLQHTATIATDLRPIVIELFSDVAPNHVRNFIALAKVGYYDGLEFDRALHEKLQDDEIFECVEAGCPLGEGSANHGSIGYWLKPEVSDKVKHDVGTLGAWHAEELETAACKFYINLSKAPWMDGNYTVFGKVTSGLDVVRMIRNRPVRDDDRERPVNPVVIRGVTIASREVD